MTNLVAKAARTRVFDENSLRLSLGVTARRSYGDGATVSQALEEGKKQEVSHTMADGIITQAEEFPPKSGIPEPLTTQPPCRQEARS